MLIKTIITTIILITYTIFNSYILIFSYLNYLRTIIAVSIISFETNTVIKRFVEFGFEQYNIERFAQTYIDR